MTQFTAMLNAWDSYEAVQWSLVVHEWPKRPGAREPVLRLQGSIPARGESDPEMWIRDTMEAILSY